MSSPLLYFYDMKSGEILSSRVAQKRPNGQFILDVQGATSVAPPEVSEGQAACWDGHAWQIKEDHRQKRDKGGVIIEGSGTDFWLPASVSVPAQSANSLSLGYFHSTDDNDFEFSVEGYYKRLLNQLEFSGELFDLVNQTYHVEDHLLYGNGHSYGVEFMLKKNSGRSSSIL